MATASKIDLDKERDDLVQANALLDDIHFERPARFSESLNCCEVSWLRPQVLTRDPDVYAFDTTKETRIAIFQSNPEFDWFMIPLANMCLCPNLVFNILPSTECFSNKYGGMFKVRFHDSGKWIEIAIDDRLPHHTCKPPDWPFYVVHNSPSGYWLPLIIKAYAKLHGSYEKLLHGTIHDGYGELTSGVTETFKMDELPPRFHISLKKYHDCACLMNAKYVFSKNGKDHPSHWAIVDVKNKTNDIANSKPVDITVKLQYLFTVPGGKSIMDYVECSKLMKLLMKLNSRDNETGAYWMSFNDFVHTFTELNVCTLDWGVAVFVRRPLVKLNSYKFNGVWYTSSSSSHSLYDPEAPSRPSVSRPSTPTSVLSQNLCPQVMRNTQWPRRLFTKDNGSIPFWSFPQFKFELRETDTYRNDKRCEFLVALQQPGHLYNPSVALIGFFIYRLVKENEPLPVGPKFFKMYRPVTQAIEHGRLIQNRLKLAVGTYLIIAVAEPENQNNFFLTVITEAKYDVWGFVPQRAVVTRALRIPSVLSHISGSKAPSRGRYSHLKRMSQDPSITPTPSELIPKT